jgi:arylsulfatase B
MHALAAAGRHAAHQPGGEKRDPAHGISHLQSLLGATLSRLACLLRPEPTLRRYVPAATYSAHRLPAPQPTRASLMTGRYPWGVGYYDMKGPEMVPLSFVMLPQLLHDMGFATHALGKWNLGNLVKDFTPTYRGFDTFTGYYAAALKDYWYHGNPTACKTSNCSEPGAGPLCSSPTDLSNSSGPTVAPADAPGVNGTYDEIVFTNEAVRLIRGADPTKGFYMYLAYQNVHSTAQNPAILSGSHPIQAPCSVIDTYCEHIAADTYKAQGGALTTLDFGVGNVTAAMDALARPYLITFVADNGGPLPHSTNAPYRGGKHTLWDGGVRVVSFITGTETRPFAPFVYKNDHLTKTGSGQT